MKMREGEEVTAEAAARLGIDSVDSQRAVNVAILRHVLEPVANGLVDLKAVIEHGGDGDLAVRGPVGLGDDVGEDSRPEGELFRREELAHGWIADPLGDHV